ncbi:MAG: hypothetical protein CMI09_03305 [Oceanospirillaceae bacterium]|nr:hypothetical protein [Oceanospirillaceae bacterium]
MTTDWTWEHWFWACLFVAGAFYMVTDLSYRFVRWFLRTVLPTRWHIPIGQGDDVTVWAYSLERAIVKAAAKDGYQHIMERIGWTPMPRAQALSQNIQWLFYNEWKSRLEYRRYSHSDTWELLAALIEIYGAPERQCWAAMTEAISTTYRRWNESRLICWINWSTQCKPYPSACNQPLHH